MKIFRGITKEFISLINGYEFYRWNVHAPIFDIGDGINKCEGKGVRITFNPLCERIELLYGCQGQVIQVKNIIYKNKHDFIVIDLNDEEIRINV